MVPRDSGLEADRVYEVLYLYVDGAAEPNPGPAGAGVVALDEDKEEVFAFKEFLGEKTNNEAEYGSLILGLQYLLKNYDVKKLIVHSDSELVVKQINGEFRTKKPELKVLKKEVDGLLKRFKDVRIKQIPRERNIRADRLSLEAIKILGGKNKRLIINMETVRRYCKKYCRVGEFDNQDCESQGCRLLDFIKMES